ncbi:ABC transporter transmembrane domain-containing protein [Sansalvadorimonas sp. 2012CJ34-2]|uniref:ABC transporter transmembrane domain-containing protein n=1 Tax=Parendozoicomonas callyspongiae TaxID=2942213 RepID=A0ABT0PHB3_9GAMM|nr:ABC transporter transmembrane domain-containing protein [Sansalvadorimonas sp. 2012CJ34-2]MCL6270646.1 ABC transporter transmembrane domain-containing protein [Sansalvadorimonas sp. 2012CJ34-2]
MSLLWKLRHYLKEYWVNYLVAFIGLQTVALLNLTPPWLIGRIVDEISKKTLTANFLIWHLTAIAAAAVAMYLLRWFWRTQLYGSSINLAKKMRSDLFAHFTRLSPSFYQRHSTGDLMAHATNDLNAIEQAAGGGIMTMVDSLIAGITVMGGMILVVSGKLTMMALLPFPLLAYFTHVFGVNLHKRFGKSQATFSSLNEEVRETVSGIRAVRAHGIGKRQQSRFNKLTDDTLEANMAVARVDALFWPTITVIYGMSFVITLGYGAWMISQGQLTVGLLTSFTLYLAQLLGPMLQFGWQFNVFQRGSASWERLEKLFAQQPDIVDGEQELAGTNAGDIRFEVKEFSYPEADYASLKNISLNVPAGGFVGITGRTGSGKSTLLKLVLRHFNLGSDSSITLGNHRVEDLTLESLRRHIAWVPQQSMLFSGTIAENIAFACPEATQEEIERAADMAGIKEEIEAFRDGYQTMLGENGINLSGGQKQRVNLARALLSDADILLLDDPFSALDMKTEARVLKNLKRFYSHKTILLVTQRLPELVEADWTVVLEQGEIIEQGNHKALLSHNGWYARIFRQQSRRSDKEQDNTELLSGVSASLAGGAA